LLLLMAAPTIVSFWSLQFSPCKPLDVVSYKCRWQLGLSLFYEPVDSQLDAFFRRLGVRGCPMGGTARCGDRLFRTFYNDWSSTLIRPGTGHGAASVWCRPFYDFAF
jgi:hypothetical protein